jgi:xylulokinase
MLLLGIDLGTSSVKVTVVDSDSKEIVASTHFPESEAEIIAPQQGWAEQSPETWWEHVKRAIIKLNAQKKYNPLHISAIGIAYQMHGLVVVDAAQKLLRNSIIWCDSRAVDIGEKAFVAIGKQHCLAHLLNSPGNFTASKLAWVKENEPILFEKIDKVMLPGDYIGMQLTGTITTTVSALSEGIFWDFKNKDLSTDVFNYFNFKKSFIPTIQDVFSDHGRVTTTIANELGLKPGTPITYKAGDQPNNALSLHVMHPGEVAATAGTSGVIYAVGDQLQYDTQSRVNSFAHVNHTANNPRIGTLLCINGTGILNRWVKNNIGLSTDYNKINAIAEKVEVGSNGISILPFGNGAERMLGNRIIGAQVHGLDLGIHTSAHIYRAAQEGIAFAFKYGMNILAANNLKPSVIRAGKANLFLSSVFRKSFVNALQIPLEFYNTDGSFGAAIGSGVGHKVYANVDEAFGAIEPTQIIEPSEPLLYQDLYAMWEEKLNKQLS